MPTVNIRGTTINFPDSGESPNWAPAIIQFAETTADAINSVVSTYDVSPASFNLDAFNGSGADITDLTFSPTTVVSAQIYYAVYRKRDAVELSESGNIELVYNFTSSPKWQVTQDGEGDAKITFSVADGGQVSFVTEAIPGTGSHTGKIVYRAQTSLV